MVRKTYQYRVIFVSFKCQPLQISNIETLKITIKILTLLNGSKLVTQCINKFKRTTTKSSSYMCMVQVNKSQTLSQLTFFFSTVVSCLHVLGSAVLFFVVFLYRWHCRWLWNSGRRWRREWLYSCVMNSITCRRQSRQPFRHIVTFRNFEYDLCAL